MVNNKWGSGQNPRAGDWWNRMDKSERIEILLKADTIKPGLKYSDYKYRWLPDEIKKFVREAYKKGVNNS